LDENDLVSQVVSASSVRKARWCNSTQVAK